MKPPTPAALDALDALIEETAEREVRELFLVPGEPPTVRGPGGIERLAGEPWTAEQTRALAEALAGAELAAIGPQVGELTRWHTVPGVGAARCTLARSAGQLTVAVMRVPETIPSTARVGLPDAVVEAALGGPGLVVFSGLSGSGKSTSALALLEHVNAHRPWHICTVEDPIAVRFEPKQALIQQRQVGLDAPTVIAGLRAGMRQDPDVLYVSEIKSVAELQACVTAAAAGHLVVVVLIAASARDAVAKMLDSFPADVAGPARRALAANLRAVVCQRLVPKPGPGRVAACEALLPDEVTRDAIAEGAADFPWPAAGPTMDDALDGLLAAGTIDGPTRERARTMRQGRLDRAPSAR